MGLSIQPEAKETSALPIRNRGLCCPLGATPPGHGHLPSLGPFSAPSSCPQPVLEPPEGTAWMLIPPCRPRPGNDHRKLWVSGCDLSHFTVVETEAQEPVRGHPAPKGQNRADPSLTKFHVPLVSQGLWGPGERVINGHPTIPPTGAALSPAAPGPLDDIQADSSAIQAEQGLSCGTLGHETSPSFLLLSTSQQRPTGRADAPVCQCPRAEEMPTHSFSQRPGCSLSYGHL